jgi:peptidoglycan/LPS O-acetylase OafA/YrhL
VQQTVYALFAPSMGFWTMMVVAFAVTTVLAWLSSVLIERPALALKPILSRRLARAPA